jgi:fluoride exporter
LINLLLVAVGGALGSVLRFTLSRAVQGQSAFPIGTFAVNVIGCLVVGLVAGLAFERSSLSPRATLFLIFGVCGGFTTFSSFSYETLKLVESGELWRAGLNAGGQLVTGLAAVWAGLALARWL